MSVTVRVIDGADRSASTITNLPPTAPISLLKQKIAELNGLDSFESIRIVRRGRVFQGTDTVAQLDIAPDSTVIVYATGVPGKVVALPDLEPPPVRRPPSRALCIGLIVLIIATLAAVFGRTSKSDVSACQKFNFFRTQRSI